MQVKSEALGRRNWWLKGDAEREPEPFWLPWLCTARNSLRFQRHAWRRFFDGNQFAGGACNGPAAVGASAMAWNNGVTLERSMRPTPGRAIADDGQQRCGNRSDDRWLVNSQLTLRKRTRVGLTGPLCPQPVWIEEYISASLQHERYAAPRYALASRSRSAPFLTRSFLGCG